MEDTAASCASLCVLGSGSGGNCSVLRIGSGPTARLWLIDAGFSARRTKRLLIEIGYSLAQVRGIILTHLDTDHYYTGWITTLPDHITLHMHKRHVSRARQAGVLHHRTVPFDRTFMLDQDIEAAPMLMSHDDLGVAAFRIRTPSGDLGFATDVGAPSTELIEHMTTVDTLALESNHCTHMQLASGRPRFLIDRIMGGRGHLNNGQAARLIRAIRPRSHVVLLHLSRECNTPEKAAEAHEAASYQLTISTQFTPTPWVPISAPAGRPREPLTRLPGYLEWPEHPAPQVASAAPLLF